MPFGDEAAMGDPVSERIERIGNSAIVYDDTLVGETSVRSFDRLRARGSYDSSTPAAGRGATADVIVDGLPCVLRHYYRGGTIRHLSSDLFAWLGEDRTRSFAEWRLLAELRQRSLPVPRPVAAGYVRRGLVYTADLLTERLPGVRPLASLLGDTPGDGSVWREVGATIARFHEARVCHADLNAHNIQVGENGEVYLLDFDRGRIMPRAGAWTRRNLARLRRSLDKVSAGDGSRVRPADWERLLDGYAGRGDG